MLLREPPIRLVTAMRKEVGTRFKEVAPSADEVNVGLWRWVKFTLCVAIRFDGRSTTDIQPIVWLLLAVQKVQHHLFVIAEQWDDPAFVPQCQDLFDHLPALRTAIDAIAQSDERVFWLRSNNVDDRAQRLRASVDIADSYYAWWHILPSVSGEPSWIVASTNR